MENYINIGGRQIQLTKEQLEQLTEVLGMKTELKKPLTDFQSGDTAKIGGFEMAVLEQFGQETALILKDLYVEEYEFGDKNNNFKDSYVLQQCKKFANELAIYVGRDNIVPHEVDLTSDDGLKDYGTVTCQASLLTADQYRKYVDVLDKVKLDKWWWLATPWSTARHDHEVCARCVAPSGRIGRDNYYNGCGVRPFCILKSSIFVSC